MEATTSNEDVLVVLQTENGEEIALPMSALPDDFVPGDSGQIIMVESPLEHEQQEVVVESSSEQHQTNVTEGDKPAPRTYSKIKSYAPTCGTTRIYQQPTTDSPAAELAPQVSDIKLESKLTTTTTTTATTATTTTTTTNTNTTTTTTTATTTTNMTSTTPGDPQIDIQNSIMPHKKQKRKETLLTKSFNEGDMEFQFIDEHFDGPQIREIERKPRKEYRTKKKRLALEAKKEITREESKTEETKKEESKKEESKKEEFKKEEQEKETKEEPNKVEEIKEEPKKGEIKRKSKDRQSAEHVKPQPQLPQTERRTRLSNACRVATGKSYRCNDCDFSTDRINNIILHVKESCPKIKAR